MSSATSEKVDGLYKAVAVRIGSNGRLERIGAIWQPSIDLARRDGARALANLLVVRVEILRLDRSLVERMMPP